MKNETKIFIRDVLIALLLLLVLAFTQVKSQTKYELKADDSLLRLSKFIMLDNVGVKERTGNNDGEKVAEILESVGIFKPAPYCQAFVYYCFAQAKKELITCGQIAGIPIPKSAVAQSSFNYAKNNGRRTSYAPKINDLIVWKSAKSWSGHVERIYKVLDNGFVLTVGANTNNGLSGSQNEGNGIYKRKRNVKHFLGRLRIRGLVGFRSK